MAATAASAQLHPVPKFAIPRDPLTITRAVKPRKPFTVAGERAAILGQQSGEFEAWLFPVKILSRFRISAEIENYPVPLDVTEQAAAIEVSPAMTTITYSHAAFTVKQRMFAPRGSEPGLVALFEIQSVRRMTLTFQFRPDMERMWPAPNFGIPNAEWVKQSGSGYYVLHTDNPDLSAAIAIPDAQPGILAPYQERPKTWPVEFRLFFDPAVGTRFFYPLLIAPSPSPVELARLNDRIPQLWTETRQYYAHFFDTRLRSETPDSQFDQALQWAEIAIDQGRVRFHDETGLIAGYYSSGDSARPGFAWFFGRDSLWTSYAIDSYGDFGLTRQIMEFLIRRQRADGKIMHEFSQTADLVDWKSTPYFYAAADATPLFIMAMEDYVNASGDTAFLRKNWDAVRRAWTFTRSHDTDEDGIYDNAEGTGWVESWPAVPGNPGGMPHQEIYLAALDEQSADAMSRLAALTGDASLASAARQQAGLIRRTIESEYSDAGTQFYAFSRNANGSLDRSATIFPAVAWWTGHWSLPRSDNMLNRWASPEFSTDWGTRDLSDRTPFFDPISYHQGSVWPLYTGWVSLAEFRAGRTLSGYSHLMQNMDLTWAQDPGAVTELLSGAFFQPLGRSSSHQIWSSAMALTPAVRGVFGVEVDALHNAIHLAPHLPATWNHATLRNVPVGNISVDLEFTRDAGRLRVNTKGNVCLAPANQECRIPAQELSLPLPDAEVEIPHGLPLPGSPPGQLKVTGERVSANGIYYDFQAPAGAAYDLPLRLNRVGIRASGAEIAGNVLRLRFPAGEGWQTLSVNLTW